jgi:transposase
MVAEQALRRRFRLIEPHLNERLRRLVAAAEVAAAGAGGVSAVARATGVSRRAIRAGAKELKARGAAALAPGRIRRPGGGRKRTIDQDPTLVTDLEKLIEPTTRGDPESPLRWTCKSVRRLATELTGQGHHTSHRMVAALLLQLGYSLQANRKTIEGTRHPDRPARAAETGRPPPPADLRVPLPARHQQVEQDRTPPVLLHQSELARPAVGQPRGHRESDRGHHHPDRTPGAGAPGHAAVSLGPQGQSRRL